MTNKTYTETLDSTKSAIFDLLTQRMYLFRGASVLETRKCPVPELVKALEEKVLRLQGDTNVLKEYRDPEDANLYKWIFTVHSDLFPVVDKVLTWLKANCKVELEENNSVDRKKSFYRIVVIFNSAAESSPKKSGSKSSAAA